MFRQLVQQETLASAIITNDGHCFEGSHTGGSKMLYRVIADFKASILDLDELHLGRVMRIGTYSLEWDEMVF